MRTSGSVTTSVDEYAQSRFEYSGGGDLVYRGTHPLYNAGTDEADWSVYKYTWGSDGITLIECLTGAWDNRATLDWE